MNKLTPAILKDLKLISTRLPTVMNETKEYHYLTGRELKLMDIEEDQQGNPLIDDRKYKWAMPVLLSSNHYQRLKNIFVKGGEKAVIEYIMKVKAMPVTT